MMRYLVRMAEFRHFIFSNCLDNAPMDNFWFDGDRTRPSQPLHKPWGYQVSIVLVNRDLLQ